MAHQYSDSALCRSFADANQPSLQHSTWTFSSQSNQTASTQSNLYSAFSQVVPPNSHYPITSSPSISVKTGVQISLSTLQPVIAGYKSILCDWNNCGMIIENQDNKFPEHLVYHHRVPTHSRSNTSTTPCFWKGCDQERSVADNLRGVLLHVAEAHLKMSLIICPLCGNMQDRLTYKFHARADHPEAEVVP